MNLSELIRLYRGPLVGLIASWGAPWADATEIAQDSFAEAYLNRKSCRGDFSKPDVFGRWLRGIARNQFRNWTRSRRRRERLVIVDSAAVEQAAIATEQEPSEQLQRLRAAIERLSADHRQVIWMHYLDETSVKEIAVLLSLPAKTVEGRLYQARRELFRMLNNEPPAALIGKVLICL